MSKSKSSPHLYLLVFLLVIVVGLLIPASSTVVADHTPDPTTVTVVGSLQDELGCPGDWQPECASTFIGYDGEDDVWQGTFNLPASSYEYKAALNGTWDENYGAGGVQGGANIPLNLAADTMVKFYYDHKSHWVTDNVNSMIATAAGDFQSELGCSGDWSPGCLRSWLQDLDGDGVYTFATDQIPVGNYEFKVALNEAWDTSYPGSNQPFAVAAAGDLVTISWDSATTAVSVDVSGAPPPVEWVVAGNFQDDLPVSAACGEWNNACPETTMEDNNADGVFRLEGNDLPAGDYEYKIVEFNNWDNAHPANNVAFSADGSQMRWYFQPGPNNVADNANQCIATVAGNFQGELGGPEWAPSNLRSMMWQEEPGSDWYAFTATLPAGNWEYKVARDEDWAESYPGGNMVLSLSAESTVTFRYNCATNDVEHSSDGLEPGDEALVRGSLRTDLANESFYFVLPDRFENGDTSNDSGGDLSGDPLVNGFLPTDKGFYHGGDIAGLQAKLDYLQGLGVTAIWMTPQFTNSWVQGDGTIAGSSAAYHGYWQIDLTQIDPHFGTNQEMQKFIADAHERGMKVFFDIVLNHTGDVITNTEGTFTYRSKADFPYRDADGVIFNDRDYAGTGTFPALDPAVSFPYTPIFATAEDATAKSPAWLNNPIYYHNRGDSTFTGESSQYGDFYGLDDLFTEHPNVVNGMIDVYQNMITTFDVDGFRVDTVKHVNDELWEAFVPAILNHAASQGKNDFFVFGEVYSGDPAFTSRYTTQLPFPSVLDFGFDGAATAFAARSEATDQVRDFFVSDDYYIDDDSNAYGLVKFIGNHDIGRLGYAIDSSNPGATDDERVAREELGYALAYFSRGIPLIYYGDEQGFTGDGGDKDARQDMMPSLVPSYNDDNLIGTSATTADANFDTTHPLYQTFSELAGIRNAHVALRQGAQIHRYSQNSAGIYAFSRIDPVERVEYLVVLNNSESTETAEFAVGTPGVNFSEVYDSGNSALTANAATVSITMEGLSSVVYRADSGLPIVSSAPGISINTPAPGAEVLGRVQVGATVSSDAYAEVTFAVSVDGAEYAVIGTDDNAPYNIFYDVSGLLPGSQLTFKAIVNADGNLNAAKVTVVVGQETPPAPSGSSDYAVIHYLRADGDYGDHTTGDYNDYWGLHLWGDIQETIEWTAPKPFLGEDEYGRFAWVRLAEGASEVGFIVHRGDTKDGSGADRFFNPSVTPEIWLKGGDDTIYTSQAAAQGYVTVRYHRDDGDYGDPTSPDYNNFWGLHLWGDAIADGVGTDWTSPRPFDGVDDFGAYWIVPIKAVDVPVNFIIHRGDAKDPGPDESFIPAEIPTVWKQSGDEAIYPSRGAAENTVVLRYHRDDGDYGDYNSTDFNDFWGMHVWTGAANPNPSWQEPLKPVGFDVFGPIFNVPLVADATQLAYILHRGDAKDPGPDQFLVLNEWGYEVWQLQGEAPDPEKPHYVLPILVAGGANAGNIDQQSAYWVDEKTIAWDAATNPDLTYTLHYAPEGGLEATGGGITGGSSVTLVPAALSDEVKAKFPHLADLPGLRIADADLALVPEILKGQIAVSAVNADGFSVDATGLQIPGVLDDLYTYGGELGSSWNGDVPTIRLWAPTAKSVALHIFDTSTSEPASKIISMDPGEQGTWSVTGDASWKGKYYLYEVEVYVHSTGQVEHNMVTDPYSISLAMNSTRSQIVDLNDAALKPAGWDELSKPELVAPEDITIYEIHMRDFSVNDASVPDELKGTYMAFTLPDSNGVNHLKALQGAGLSHLHLLPVFDIATIDENKAEWQEPDWDVLGTYAPDSEEQQAAVTAVENLDGFNWGYDPFHYTTPEGSYSTNPDGPTRILEFRKMVQALNEDIDLRVVMDVVYNHTNSAGQDPKSVLDKIVPGYYHRLDDKGNIETSTCCENTATENNMMEKLMIDSLVVWARDYKIDAFRFDLMGHHSLANMLNVQAALAEIDPDIYIYGEGWNFGEVADNARFVQATQLNLGGTGIGSFSDRLRDAVRGGSPFDSGDDLVRRQGWANGLFYDPNELNTSPEPSPEPSSVTIVGSLQSELGCPGDWQPECAATHLAYDAADTAWQQTFTVPAGSWEYKAAIDDSWDVNYGANAEPSGPNIALNLGASTDVKFYYSNATHWVTDNVNAVIATVPGSYQAAIGCPGDWQPDCLRSWLQDPDGDGIYSFSTIDIPPGDYEAKVAINESWDLNYGQGGEQNGPNYQFTVEAGQEVLFSYDSVSHVLTISFGSSDQLATLLLLSDQIRVGMAGNLADYQFIDRYGNLVTGADVDYNGQPAGYTQDPQEDITYISKHDNQTLYDNNTYKIPWAVSMTDRVRVQNVGLSTVLLGQGVPFMQAGSDLLRSKSFDRDSYNSGDWFNKLDFTYQDNNFGVGLPVAGKNQDNWYLMGPRLSDPALTPGMEDIMFSAGLFQELLAIRDSSPLFHLQTGEDVQARVMFHNTGPSQLPGLIVMTISDMVEPDLDANMEQMVVLINANDEAQSFTLAGAAGSYLDPHRVQQNSVDPLVKMASFDQASGTFYVPGRTAVVFVEYTPQARIEFLIDDVEALVEAGVLNAGQGNALVVKLEGALVKLNGGQAHVSINRLQAFVNQVYDFVEDGILSPSQGQDLIDKANSIIDQIDALY